LFSSVLRNYISSEIQEDIPPAMPTSPGVRQFINIDNAFMGGFEFNWKQDITPIVFHDLSLSYTYGQNQVLEEPLPEIAPFELRYRLVASLLKNKVQPELVWRSVAKQSRIANSYGETETPGFNVLDAKLSWQINEVLTAAGGVQNIIDTAYYEHLTRSVHNAEKRPIYSPGRSFYITLTVSLM
jgi:iron complex outermembrane receptor protein